MQTLGALYQSGALTPDIVLRVVKAYFDSSSYEAFCQYCSDQEIPASITILFRPSSTLAEQQTIAFTEDAKVLPVSSLKHKGIEEQKTLVLGIETSVQISDVEEGFEYLSEYYEDLGPIASGGMGQVRRVREHKFHRLLAMKIIHPHLRKYDIMIEKFREEAQVISQLQHPNIIPVHDMGSLVDGREYYTMKEIRGEHLGKHISAVYSASEGGVQWKETEDGWSFRRLITAFHQACLGVSHAHRHGVLHRDLKPENIMVEPNGTAIVMDWGLAKILSRTEKHNLEEYIVTERVLSGGFQTLAGQVAGTPAYMSPEQARGENDRLTLASDVYSLGTVLYEILIGTVPYKGDTAADILSQVIEGPPKDPSEFTSHISHNFKTISIPPIHTALPKALSEDESQREEKRFVFPKNSHYPIPEALIEICTKAMARLPQDRYQDATELADALLDWLDGAKKREQGLAVVAKALALDERIASLRKKSEEKASEARMLLENISSWASEERKAKGWLAEDLAAELLLQAEIHEVEKEQLLKASLSHKEDLEEAHLPLIEEYFRQHKFFEEQHDRKRRKQVEVHLRYHIQALPTHHAMRQSVMTYLKGLGALTLVISENVLSVTIQRFVLQNRRLVLSKPKPLDPASIREHPLQKGSYVVTCTTTSGVQVRYPVRISRLEHWNPIHPHTQQQVPLILPTGAISDCVVPAGWFYCGGDPEALNVLPRKKVWIDSFVMQKFPVTNRDFLVFLNALVMEGREQEALRFVPREKMTKNAQEGEMVYRRDSMGEFLIPDDPDGKLWHLDYPVCMVSWNAAQAYAHWMREKTGIEWRLPTELEWEKAARGVDERIFVWGNFLDPSWTRMRYTLEGDPKPSVVNAYPIDESVYGVRGMAGNMCEWTASFFFEEGVPIENGCPVPQSQQTPGVKGRVRRGGSWYYDSRISRAAFRYPDFPDFRNEYISFRLVYSLPSEEVSN